MKKKKKTSKADLHIHSTFSDGQDTPRKIVKKAIEKDLSVIAITDHNRIKGAIEAQNYVKEEKLPIDVIIGEEVYTQEGEIIGLFLKNHITPHKTAKETCQEIKKQGGLVIAPHPASIIGGVGLSYKKIRELEKEKLIDAIEIYNGGDIIRFDRHLTKHKVHFPHLAKVAGSDSHQERDLGDCFTYFSGSTALDLKKAIKERKTIPAQISSYLTLAHILGYILRGVPRMLKKDRHYPHKTKISFKIKSMLRQIKEKYWQIPEFRMETHHLE